VHITTTTGRTFAFCRLFLLFSMLGLLFLGSQLPGRCQADTSAAPSATAATDATPAPESLATGENTTATGSSTAVAKHGKAKKGDVAAAKKSAAKKTRLISKTNAVVLGVVEGITEYLPVSSTAHLLVTQHLLNIVGKNADEKIKAKENEAIDAYTVIIQFGAILAVLLLFWGRVREVFAGFFGKNPAGARLGINLIVALLPAAVIGALIEKRIDKLFDTWAMNAIILAWFIGGLIILFVAWGRRKALSTDGKTMADLTIGQALGIGVLQCFAMWPGVSRSLTTILGGLWVGLSMAAAVEFSFLLGLLTLTGATVLKLAKHHHVIHQYLGNTAPAIGIIFAGIAAFVAVKWMIGYLNKHGLGIFGYYRIAAAAGLLAMMAASVIK